VRQVQRACGCGGACCHDQPGADSGATGDPTLARLLQLQRSVGNRALSQVVQRRPATTVRPVRPAAGTALQRDGDDPGAGPGPAPAPATDDPLPPGPFPGETHEVEVAGRTFSFQGRTRASYAHSWDHENDAVTGGVRTGTLVENFSVTTAVTLPPAPAGLSDCEAQIVDTAINVTLANHEQQHVNAFNGYTGTVRSPYSVTGGADAATAALAARHTANERARRAATDAASAALDPFNVPVDTSSCDTPASP